MQFITIHQNKEYPMLALRSEKDAMGDHTLKCPHCKRRINTGYNYCPSCGQKIHSKYCTEPDQQDELLVGYGEKIDYSIHSVNRGMKHSGNPKEPARILKKNYKEEFNISSMQVIDKSESKPKPRNTRKRSSNSVSSNPVV
ncbi:zinc ribbon domain-containing protein [Ileibacterium valens]|uniref:zinc ribbon domain-containing protein n=1 Tax=Ileibacterium valens TaxID=1862668 RepID=UPI002570A383|nr:zinc ribbon domain-containing protein [Ileibacterium valens]